jgi:hypothetical protein
MLTRLGSSGNVRQLGKTVDELISILLVRRLLPGGLGGLDQSSSAAL